MNPSQLHAALSNASLFFLALSGALGLASLLFQGRVSPTYKGVLVVGEILLVAVALVGLLAWTQGRGPGALHFLYAALSVLAFPGIFAFTRGGMGRREALLYALASFVMIGFIIRAGQTS
ncbi:MAG: hypothetical protein HY330_04250 [Chloroflexi bacterium]|nr:hypothetical protein [Chloroflexota bacterium]